MLVIAVHLNRVFNYLVDRAGSVTLILLNFVPLLAEVTNLVANEAMMTLRSGY